jgi:hypothetical protein
LEGEVSNQIIKDMLQIVDIATVKSFRKFTLTSGYNATNTQFVRVSDGYTVGADPLKIKKGDTYATHHVRGCGYLYACRKGYVMATLKGGYQGWTDLVEVATNTYKCFNPFEGRTLTIVNEDGYLCIDDGKQKEGIDVGVYSTVFGEISIFASPFKGLKGFMRNICQLPEWATEHVNNVSYNADFTKKYNMGEVTTGQFDPLADAGVITCEFKKITTDYGYKLIIQHPSGRYFISGKSDYDCGKELLINKGVILLDWYGSDMCNSENETTQYVWDSVESAVETGLILLDKELPRPLHPVEIALLNLPQGECNDYIVMQYIKESLVLGEATNGGMRDQNIQRDGRNAAHENVVAVYDALLRLARKSCSKSAQMLCDLIHQPYKVECLDWHYQFESDKLLGTFLHACMRNGKDMQRLWLSAISCQPRPMVDWLNSNLVYWVETRYMGYHPSNGSEWLERRNYQGVITWIASGKYSFYGNFQSVELSENEAQVLIIELARQREQKV